MGHNGSRAGVQPAYRVRSTFHAPPAEFNGCFTTFYHMQLEVDGGATLCDALQPEWGNIRFFNGDLPDARIGTSRVSGARFSATGPSSKPAQFELGSTRMWGIGFLPLGWARYFDAPASAVTDLVVDGSHHAVFAHFGPLAERLCDPQAGIEEQYDAIVQAMRRLVRPSRDEDAILRVNRVLVDADFVTVREFADRAEIGVRTLERLCRRYFGFPPKLLVRRQRFMRTLADFMLHEDSKWTEVIDNTYHDQAQFTREFHDFMGMNPREYAAQDHPILASFMEARARIWGSPAQTLDAPERARD